MPMILVIITSHGWVSLRGVCLDWRGPFEIGQVANEGQQPLIGDIQKSELRGLPLLLRFISGSLLIFALPLAGLRRLLPFRLAVSSCLARDHDCLSCCTNVIFQG